MAPAVPGIYHSKTTIFQVSRRRSGIPLPYLEMSQRRVLVVATNSTDGAEDEATVYGYRMTSLPSFRLGFRILGFLGFRTLKNSILNLFFVPRRISLLKKFPRRKRTKIGRSPKKTKGLPDDHGSL
ncbi:hypothetical protein TNIN_430341 [Trichonephila inaurata madagascariensis]|uniref:Uncharacterized protein n=1 Tax=Trichonephila inaurata madagascariensis TaxID=2747483 RepID=A0A8X6IXC6_9ARAC|nr:hypothetical protein TNIN_430341 [Trichonephila inaurata madagascariensis]